MNLRFLGMVLGLLLAGCGVRRGDNVLIPEDYQGWVQIHYQVNSAPQLRQEAGRNLIEVPSSGIVRTGSSRSHGYGVDHYFSADGKGFRAEITSDSGQKTGRSATGFQYFSSPAQVTIFFVGDTKKINAYSRPNT